MIVCSMVVFWDVGGVIKRTIEKTILDTMRETVPFMIGGSAPKRKRTINEK